MLIFFSFGFVVRCRSSNRELFTIFFSVFVLFGASRECDLRCRLESKIETRKSAVENCWGANCGTGIYEWLFVFSAIHRCLRGRMDEKRRTRRAFPFSLAGTARISCSQTKRHKLNAKLIPKWAPRVGRCHCLELSIKLIIATINSDKRSRTRHVPMPSSYINAKHLLGMKQCRQEI